MYNIDLDLVGISAIDSNLFTDSKLRWESIIRSDLPSIPGDLLSVPPLEGCVYPSIIDDLYICAQFAPIDGPFNIVGSARVIYIRRDSDSGSKYFSLTGEMRFDSADITFIKSLGAFGTVILHEIGHLLGTFVHSWQKG